MRVAGAIDIGGTRTKLGIVADDGRVIDHATVATTEQGDPEPLVGRIAAALKPLLASAIAPRALEPMIGVSVAGFLDRDRSFMYGNANLPALNGYPLRRALETILERQCVLEVDSNAAALAEHRYGAARGCKRLLSVTVGTGLGGAVVLDGSLLRYTGECAGDLGHVIVAEEGRRRRCTCGSEGCLEAMVCAAALSERAGGNSVRTIVRNAKAGDRQALDAIAETARWLGLGLASLAPLFAPDTIVVGGGVGAAGDLLLDHVRASFRSHAGSDLRDAVRITGSTFEGWDGVIGAASTAFEHAR